MSGKVQIILTLGQSLSVGSTSQPIVLSSDPRFPDNALALDFGNSRLLANGWGTSAANESLFKGFAPIVETRTETHVSGMINRLIHNFTEAGAPPPIFVHINAGFGGASIIQLMISASDIFSNLETGMSATSVGNVFVVRRDDGQFDGYYRTETSSIFLRTVPGPFNVFDNVEKQIRLANSHAVELGYDVDSTILFNFIQGQSDSGPYYSNVLNELVNKVERITDSIMGSGSSLIGVVSQVRGYGGKQTSFEQLEFINLDDRIGLGVTEFQYQASHPSRPGGDYTHLNAEGYFLVGQEIGDKIFDFMQGRENKPILIERIEYLSPDSIRVHFSGVENFLVIDDQIFDQRNLIRPPSNLGFSVGQAEGEIRPTFSIKEAFISGIEHVDIIFDGDVDRNFVLFLGRNQENLGDIFGVHLNNFGGNVLRDARQGEALPSTSGTPLQRNYFYEYAPIQSKTVNISELLPPLSEVGPIIDGDFIFGADSSETLHGSEKGDLISGVPNLSANLGVGRVDTLVGGDGNDLFILGDARGVFYNRNSEFSYGMNDRAEILDFTLGDRIQVAPGSYFFRPIGTTVNPGTALWFDRDGNGQLSLVDELVANIWGTKRPSFADLVVSAAIITEPPPSPTPTPTPTPTSTPTPAPPVAGMTVIGTEGSDTLSGTSGDDVISGVPNISSALGKSSLDVLSGGGGDDIFLLGDDRGVFYNRNLATSYGMNDYAVITDFSDGDRVQLAAGRSYFLRAGGTLSHKGIGIWLDNDNSGSLSKYDELVAVVQGSRAITMADIIFG